MLGFGDTELHRNKEFRGRRVQGCIGRSTFASPTFDLQPRLLISDCWTTPPRAPRLVARKPEKPPRHSCARRLSVDSLAYPSSKESSVGSSIAAVVVSPDRPGRQSAPPGSAAQAIRPPHPCISPFVVARPVRPRSHGPAVQHADQHRSVHRRHNIELIR
jgi:hypothetical protein